MMGSILYMDSMKDEQEVYNDEYVDGSDEGEDSGLITARWSSDGSWIV